MENDQRAERPEPNLQELILPRTHETLTSTLCELEVHGLIRHDWSRTLANAPVCIAILGECILFCSCKHASRLYLDGREFEDKSLRTNILKIIQAGMTAFTRADVGMNKITAWSSLVSTPNGLIDTIVNLALKKSTQASTKEVFKIQVEDLRTKSDACIKEAQLIQAEMTNWGDLISEVLYAVSDRESTITKLEVEKEKRKEDMRKQKIKLEEAIVKVGNDMKASESNLKTLITHGSAFGRAFDKWSEYFRLLAPNGLLLLGTALLCAAFTAFSALESENDEAAYQKLLDTQGKELEKIIEEDERLAKDIANLQDNYKSTDEVKATLSVALHKLRELSTQMQRLLHFFASASAMVEVVHDMEKWQFTRIVQLDQIQRDEGIEERELMLTRASQVKAQFAIMRTVAQAYCDVSNESIVVGFDEISQLSLSDSSQTDNTLVSKRNRLTAMRLKNKQRVLHITKQRQNELRTELYDISKMRNWHFDIEK